MKKLVIILTVMLSVVATLSSASVEEEFKEEFFETDYRVITEAPNIFLLLGYFIYKHLWALLVGFVGVRLLEMFRIRKKAKRAAKR